MKTDVPIPVLRSNEGWKNVVIKGNGEKLVPMSGFATDPEYYLKKIPGATKILFVREGVWQRLQAAAQSLPPGYHLLIIDAWRPYAVQQALYDHYSLHLGDLTTKFVSLPSLEKTCPSPHLTGGAVDLTICDEGQNPLWMGTSFDDFTEVACTRFFEDKLARGGHLTLEETTALNNRRMLYQIMATAGFTNYSCEWWHYDYGNQFWGVVKGEPAIYGLTEP